MKKISLDEFKGALPANSWFTVRHSSLSGALATRRAVRWDGDTLTVEIFPPRENAYSGEMHFASIDVYRKWTGVYFLMVGGEELHQILDIRQEWGG